MNMIKNFFKKHIYFLGFFAFTLLYNFLIVGYKPFSDSGVFYAFHLVDFSMGFCSKILPGAIFNFLFDNITVRTANIYNIVLFVILIFIVALLLEKVIYSIEKANRKTMIFILLFFTTGTLTFSGFVSTPGSHDFYWVLFSALCVLCLSTKYLYLLIIPLSLLSVMTNYGFLVVQFPFLLMLMAYKATTLTQSKEKKFLWAVTVLTAVSSLFLGGYFVIFESENLRYTAEEFTKIMQERGLDGTPDYYLATLYNRPEYYGVTSEIPANQSAISNALHTLYNRILIALKNSHLETTIIPFLISIPCVTLFYLYFRDKRKNSEGKMSKLLFFGFVPVYFAVILVSILFSMDTNRFIIHSFTALFTSFMFVLYNEKGKDFELAEKRINKAPKLILALYSVCYFFLTVNPTA